MLRATAFSCGLAACLYLPAQAPPSLYRVPTPTPGQWLLLQQHFDVLGNCCGTAALSGHAEVIVDPAQVGLLQAIAPTAQFVRHGQPFDLTQQQQQQAAMAAGIDVPPGQYYTNAEVLAELDAQVTAYPAIAMRVDISALPGGLLTHQGRSLYALKISDNVASDEDEPAIVIAAQHHARELNSPIMVLGAIQRILAAYASDAQIQALVDGYEIYLVPTVNPDGVDYVWTTNDLWRKNRRNNGTSYGVDNNRNYPFLWGQCGASTNGGSETYRGPSAGSEPETETMRNLIATLRPELYLDFHSSGRDVLRTYAPCAAVSPTMFDFIERYVDDLAAPMGYDKRDPSASGEAPEDHWASGGTLSFLVEIGTAFQPVYSATVTEEAIVWPGTRHALTTWRPALRGHVRSAMGAAPLAATITYTPGVFQLGELCRSRGRDGRYGLWLPLGSWNVTFSAPGHEDRTVPVTVASYDTPVDFDVVLETAMPAAPTVVKAGSGSLGTVVDFTYTSPGDAGRTGFLGWSFSTSPGISLGDLRVIPLNNDPFFDAAWLGNPFLAPTWATLDGADQLHSTLTVPNLPWLVGLTTYVAGLTIDPAWQGGVKTWSPPVAVTIVP